MEESCSVDLILIYMWQDDTGTSVTSGNCDSWLRRYHSYGKAISEETCSIEFNLYNINFIKDTHCKCGWTQFVATPVVPSYSYVSDNYIPQLLLFSCSPLTTLKSKSEGSSQPRDNDGASRSNASHQMCITCASNHMCITSHVHQMCITCNVT